MDNLIDARYFGSSEYARTVIGEVWGTVPHLDSEIESELQTFLAKLASERLIYSASDVADGGLASTLARACIPTGIAVKAERHDRTNDVIAIYFAEYSSMAVITCSQVNRPRIEALVEGNDLLYCDLLGETGGSLIDLRLNGKTVIESSIAELQAVFTKTLESQLATEVLA